MKVDRGESVAPSKVTLAEVWTDYEKTLTGLVARSTLHMFSFEDDPDTAGFAARHGFTVSGVAAAEIPTQMVD